MQELMIEPHLWRLAAGWAIIGGIVGILIGAAMQFVPSGPKGGTALVAACVLGIFGAGALYGEFVDFKTANVNAELEKRGQAMLTRTRAEDARRPHAAIRISSESQREAAAKVEATLKRNGVVSTGVELIDPKAAPAAMEIRYFRSNDGRNADLLGRTINAEPVHVPGFQSAPPNFFDVWFPKA
jgi:hypothetical protein